MWLAFDTPCMAARIVFWAAVAAGHVCQASPCAGDYDQRCAVGMCRFQAVSPLPLTDAKADGRSNYRAYRALFEGKPAIVKFLFDNHESALVHARWAEAGLAPELWVSEGVKYHSYETGVHMVRGQLPLGTSPRKLHLHLIMQIWSSIGVIHVRLLQRASRAEHQLQAMKVLTIRQGVSIVEG